MGVGRGRKGDCPWSRGETGVPQGDWSWSKDRSISGFRRGRTTPRRVVGSNDRREKRKTGGRPTPPRLVPPPVCVVEESLDPDRSRDRGSGGEGSPTVQDRDRDRIVGRDTPVRGDRTEFIRGPSDDTRRADGRPRGGRGVGETFSYILFGPVFPGTETPEKEPHPLRRRTDPLPLRKTPPDTTLCPPCPHTHSPPPTFLW